MAGESRNHPRVKRLALVLLLRGTGLERKKKSLDGSYHEPTKAS